MWYLRGWNCFGRAHSYSLVTQSTSVLEETSFHFILKSSREVTTGITPFRALEKAYRHCNTGRERMLLVFRMDVCILHTQRLLPGGI